MKRFTLMYFGFGVSLLSTFYCYDAVSKPYLDREVLENLARKAITLDTEIAITKGRVKDECLTALYNIS